MAHRFRGRRWLLLGLVPVLALTAVAAPFAMAGGFGGWGGPGCHGPGDAASKMRMAADHIGPVVGLSDGQKVKVDALIGDVAPTFDIHREEGTDLRLALANELAADTVNRDEVERLRGDAIQLADRASRDAIDAMLRLHEVLTPDQRAKVRDLGAMFHGPRP